jgi:hypothetical protein
MYTFANGKKQVDSKMYTGFMSTFVYRPEMAVLGKSRA